jgi:hypothetical protein
MNVIFLGRSYVCQLKSIPQMELTLPLRVPAALDPR